jgi:hypothetical protein
LTGDTLPPCNARAGGDLYEIRSFGVRDLIDVVYCRKHSGRYSEKANLPEMEPDAHSEPSQETNAYSFPKETDTNANALSMASAHAYADRNHAFLLAPAHTDADGDPYS